MEFTTTKSATATKNTIESLSASGRKYSVNYTNPHVNPFRTLPKDAPMRKENNRGGMTGGFNAGNQNMNFNSGGMGFGIHGNVGNDHTAYNPLESQMELGPQVGSGVNGRPPRTPLLHRDADAHTRSGELPVIQDLTPRDLQGESLHSNADLTHSIIESSQNLQYTNTVKLGDKPSMAEVALTHTQKDPKQPQASLKVKNVKIMRKIESKVGRN